MKNFGWDHTTRTITIKIFFTLKQIYLTKGIFIGVVVSFWAVTMISNQEHGGEHRARRIYNHDGRKYPTLEFRQIVLV